MALQKRIEVVGPVFVVAFSCAFLISLPSLHHHFHTGYTSINSSREKHEIKGMEKRWLDDLGVKISEEDIFGAAGEKILKEMKAANIEKNLRYLTSQGNMAGTKQDLEQAEYLRAAWEQAGLDQAFLRPYDIQLSHPNINKPNKVYLVDETGEVKFRSSILEEGTYDDTIPPAFLAFSPAGIVQTNELVYVNYGRYEDFLYAEASGISLAGKLVIARFGHSFRGDKIRNAQLFNASGVILYTDPADYDHPEWQDGLSAQRGSVWLPDTGIQRGTIVWRDGDPTTPLYPALDGVYRVPEDETDTPKIPAHTISYRDAHKLLVNLGGREVPEDWQGAINITYRMGPQLVKKGWGVRLEVNNIKSIKTTNNVIGYIRGAEEPDRYVIYTNHRDSWTFGSCDPFSATAVQMEMIRAFGSMMAEGWRPRRSMVFTSWGAGEFGFFGSTEMVEEYLGVLGDRAVALLNVDQAVEHPYNLLITATPLLHKLATEATKRIPAPDPSLGYDTLFDQWSQRVRYSGQDLINYNLASISDHAPVLQRTGVPIFYTLWKKNPGLGMTEYPVYHTSFEDFDVMKTYLDPTFNYHLALARLWALVGIGLADAKLLPMEPQDETEMLRRMVWGLRQDYGSLLDYHNITLDNVEFAIDHFEETVTSFNSFVSNLTHIPPLLARQLNDQMMSLEKSYIYSEGIPTRPHMKNMVIGTSNQDQYEGVLAPGVRDAVWEATQCSESCESKWRLVDHQISILQYVINSARLIMKDIRTF